MRSLDMERPPSKALACGACRVESKTRRSGGMADAADSKSVGRKAVWVRLPPPAPYFLQRLLMYLKALCRPYRDRGKNPEERLSHENCASRGYDSVFSYAYARPRPNARGQER